MLKFNLTVLIAFTAAIQSLAQITTTKAIVKTNEDAVTKYDSSKNFVGGKPYLYLGQEVYVNGKPEDEKHYGYEGFFVDYTKESYEGGIYKQTYASHSEYDALYGRYFKVLEVFKHPRAGEISGLYSTKYFLKLQDKASNEILYFQYDTAFEFQFPFVVVGFFEKLKKQFVGQKFVLGNIKENFEDEVDIKTGKKFNFQTGAVWECVDVTINEKKYVVSLLLRDKNGQTLPLGYYAFLEPTKWSDVYTEKDAQKYKAKFGQDTWNTILNGKVRIGMNKEMCTLSWGEPNKVNQTITSGRKSEQWVYGDNRYLYFTNGSLTAIQ